MSSASQPPAEEYDDSGTSPVVGATAAPAPLSDRQQSLQSLLPEVVAELSPGDRQFLLGALVVAAILVALHGWRHHVRTSWEVQVVRAPASAEVKVPPRTAILDPPAAATTSTERPPAVTPSETAPPGPVTPTNYVFTIDVNSATWVEWAQLPGIGETLARRIVADREEHGPFRSIDDVVRVRGIGQKTLARFRPHLRMAPPEDAAAP